MTQKPSRTVARRAGASCHDLVDAHGAESGRSSTVARRAAALLFSLFFALGVSGAWAAGSDYSDDKSAQDTPYGKAVALISQEDYAGAIEQLDLALLKEPENADVLNYLGFSHRKHGNYEEAERYYLRALEIEPEHTAAPTSTSASSISRPTGRNWPRSGSRSSTMPASSAARSTTS